MEEKISRAVSEFHNLHDAFERYYPEAKLLGLPLELEWNRLKDRILKFKQTLINICEGTEESIFLQFAKSVTNKLKKSSQQIEIFNYIGCGYYGMKGQRKILETLREVSKNEDPFSKYINTTKENPHQNNNDNSNQNVCNDLHSFKSVEELLQNILTPEVCLRLIAEDFQCTLDLKKAREIMLKSKNFGVIWNNDDTEDEEFLEKKIKKKI
ncbi:hypothetical protein HDU92_003302 [Lobulomyces angularis]|nr:hypothetical protein HDU92_003302 [Lobulomyces angularis]